MQRPLTVATILIAVCANTLTANASEMQERWTGLRAISKQRDDELKKLKEQYDASSKRLIKDPKKFGKRLKKFINDKNAVYDKYRAKKKDFEETHRRKVEKNKPLPTLPPKSKPKPRKPRQFKLDMGSAKSQTKYILQDGRDLSYAIDILKTGKRVSTQRWVGTISFEVKQPTAFRNNGASHSGFARLLAEGTLKGYRQTEGDKWVRDKPEDIILPKSDVVFATNGLEKYKLDKYGRRDLPSDMHLRFTVFGAIFPWVPDYSKESEESGDVARSFMMRNVGNGYQSGINTGYGTFEKKSSGGKYTMKETLESEWKGQRVFTYATKQHANFSGGQMLSSETVFAISWDGVAKVTVKAKLK